MRIGSLFSGAGGLDMAVEAVFGGHTVWQCEMDKAASKVLAYQWGWRDVPNLGDITAVDWYEVPEIDILCGGFPCQDVSAAGKRAGIKDGTRSGLWSVFVDIDGSVAAWSDGISTIQHRHPRRPDPFPGHPPRKERNSMKHVICYSGGIGSWATAKRVISEHGAASVVLLFADVKGNNDSPHLGEDEDTYRFIRETAAAFGCELVTLNEGRSIWQVFKDKRFLGNSRLASCSHVLKQAPTKKWLIDNCHPDDTTVYVGISWDEIHRLPNIEAAYQSFGFTAKAPLCDPPYLDKAEMLADCRTDGIEPPRAYQAGFPHNNCGGFCVRAGQSQFRLLLRQNRERFLFHEAEEQKLRDYLGKDVTILTEHVNNTPVHITLREFRERQDSQPGLFDDDFDFGGCGCFTEEVNT